MNTRKASLPMPTLTTPRRLGIKGFSCLSINGILKKYLYITKNADYKQYFNNIAIRAILIVLIFFLYIWITG